MDNQLINNIIFTLSSTGAHINNPYHNLVHCNQVRQSCAGILRAMDLTPSIELEWASIFHDYDHTGGKEPDGVNIALAQAGVYKQIDKFNSYIPKFSNHKADIDKIFSLIKVTSFINGEFPYDPESLDEMIIRDADLMSIFADRDVALYLTNGLYQELLLKFPTMTREEFWEKNVNFLTNAEWYTEPVKYLVENSLQYNLDILSDLFISVDK